ncbi:MAG: hypothetical protein WA142_03940 [Rugosibacter sp.]
MTAELTPADGLLIHAPISVMIHHARPITAHPALTPYHQRRLFLALRQNILICMPQSCTVIYDTYPFNRFLAI